MSFWMIVYLVAAAVVLIRTIRFFVRTIINAPEVSFWHGSSWDEDVIEGYVCDAFIGSSVRFTLCTFLIATFINTVWLTLPHTIFYN